MTIDLEKSGEDWRELLKQLEAEGRQSLGIGKTLRTLESLDL